MTAVTLGSPDLMAGDARAALVPDLWEAGWFTLRLHLVIAAISSFRMAKVYTLRSARIMRTGSYLAAVLVLGGILALTRLLRLAAGVFVASLAGAVLWEIIWEVHSPRRSGMDFQVEGTYWGASFVWGMVCLISLALVILHARWADVLGSLRHHGEPTAVSRSPSARRDAYRALSALQFGLDAGAGLDDALKAAIRSSENQRVRYQLCFALEMVRDDATLGVGLREAGLLPPGFVAGWAALRRESDLARAVRKAAESTRGATRHREDEPVDPLVLDLSRRF
jgi:hypothetical protein